MKTELTQEQTDEYQERGFVVVEGFLDSDELETWRAHVDEAVERRHNRKMANSDAESGDSYYDNVFTQRLNLWMDHEGMRGLMLDRRIGQMAATLAGVEGIRIWHDQALIKEPWANPTAWHLDNPYWSFSSPNAISIWVALDDATFHNGCLYFLPGTHKLATYDNSGSARIWRICSRSTRIGDRRRRHRHRCRQAIARFTMVCWRMGPGPI